VVRLALAFAALLASMSLVVWRQSRALEVLRALDSARTQRAIGEAERSELNRQIEYLESRSRIVNEAHRLGLHVPSVDELVVLPLRERPSPSPAAVATARGRSAGASQP
jgi:cell division protein FtsL